MGDSQDHEAELGPTVGVVLSFFLRAMSHFPEHISNFFQWPDCHEEMPHQSLGNKPPVNRLAAETQDGDIEKTKLRIVRREQLGGRLKHYALRAA